MPENKPKKHWHWEAILALILSLVTIGYTIYNNIELSKLSFQNAGIQPRPLLKIEGTPVIKSIRATSESPITKKNINERSLGLTLSLITEVKLINKGNSIAKMMFEVVADKHSGIPEVRKFILDPDKRKNIKFSLIDDFYKVVEINPDKDRDITLSRTIKSPSNDRFTMHYMFIYSNEIGNVYDSYIWATYVQKPVKMRVADKTDTTIKLTMEPEELVKSIELEDIYEMTYMYSKKESEELLKLHKIIQIENKNTESGATPDR